MFLIPVSMAIGGALVSVPIIIHLINRMRFKRIRWAAMEFLLKSQKRNRRRLIIEQLLLLLLRCLLVLLAAFLVSRFVGCSAQGGGLGAQQTTHLIVIDDSLSEKDQWKDADGNKNSFDEGKRLVKDIVKEAGKAGAAQQVRIVRLSEIEKKDAPLFDERLTTQNLETINSKIDDLKCTDLHLSPQPAVALADEYFGEHPVGTRILHIVSDFRSKDWTGTEAEGLQQALDALCGKGVQVNLVDTAHPFRNDRGQASGNHENLGIIDLRADTRVAAANNMLVTFTATIQNFSNTDRENYFVAVQVDGADRLEGSAPVPKVPAKSTVQHTFQLIFNKVGFSVVTAQLQKEQSGLEPDDKRFAVIEVRKEVPILIIDGDFPNGMKPGGDTYYLQTVFTSASGYQVVARGPDELNRPGLEQYPSIFLCNLQEIKNDKAVKNLEDYVAGGGSVVFFLGDKVRPSYYNSRLYVDGKGLFPVPLENRPTDPLTPEEKTERLLLDEGQKIFIRSKSNPIFADVFDYQQVFRFLVLDRYHPAQPRFKWKDQASGIEELVTLPNRKDIADYKTDAQRYLNQLKAASEDDKYEKYRPGLERHYRAIRDTLNGKLYELASAVQALLNDTGSDNKDPQKPNLKEFFDLPEQQNFRTQLDKFRETVTYGDPLVLTHRFGKGKVVAFLTTAGKAWHDWPGGCPASPTYPVVMTELQKYLASGSEDLNRTVGSTLTIDLDATRYEGELQSYLLLEKPGLQAPKVDEQPKEGEPKADTGNMRSLGKILPGGDAPEGRFVFNFSDAREPGVYLLRRTIRPEPGIEARTEDKAYAFNVDTIAEGDLARAPREELERNPPNAPEGRGKIKLFNKEEDLDMLAHRQKDMSESPWVFLAFLIILVVEQALAVHLSFHLKGNEAQLPTQVLRSQGASA